MAIMYIGVAAFTPTPPIANAGPDQSFSLPTTTATLSGSGTSTDGGSIVSYAWTQTSGPSCTITSPSSASTGITGMSTAGTYTFQLEVTDNYSETGTDSISIIVSSSTDAVITLSMSQNSTQFIVQATTSIPLAVDVSVFFCGNIVQGGNTYGCGGGYAPEGTLILLAGTSSISGTFGTVNHSLGTITDFGFASSSSITPTNDGVRNITLSYPT